MRAGIASVLRSGWALGLVLSLVAGCSTTSDRAGPDADAAGASSRAELGRGKASWYGPGFQGKRTASGERFDMNALTAAHPTLAFGTRVLVRNTRNGREVVVRITDRGPHVRDRIIDLSQAAAAALGMLADGVAPVVLMGL